MIIGTRLDGTLLKGSRAFTYASLGADENLGDPRGQEHRQLAQRMFGEYQQAMAWFQPEPMSLGRETLECYADQLADAASQRWMHVFPNPGKRSGAYMSGVVYDEHPYILLNHHDDHSSVSTYAHEWGHALHQVLANQSQPQHLASFSIFTTEAAAIANELLTQTYMLSNAQKDQERLYYLGYALEQIRSTYFRQIMFSEFEGEIYAAMERGEPLPGDRITQMYGEILRRYHGADQGVMRIDELYHNEWMFEPHFYFNFYLFQYAKGEPLQGPEPFLPFASSSHGLSRGGPDETGEDGQQQQQLA